MKKICLLLLVVGTTFLALPETTPVITKDILFVVMGGYNSCSTDRNLEQSRIPVPYGTGVYKSFEGVSQKLIKNHSQLRIHFIASCLYSSPPPNGEMTFVTSKEPEKERSGSTTALMNEIEMLAHESSSVYLVGHSYGGWLGMYLAGKLRTSVSVSGLATVDPISTACGPTEFIFGATVCKQAPKDHDNKLIRSKVNTWINFYQTRDGSLHSSSIPEAKNFFIEYRGAHTQIDSDVRTWNEIEKMVLSGLYRP